MNGFCQGCVAQSLPLIRYSQLGIFYVAEYKKVKSKVLILNIKRREVKNMELKYVVPNMEKTFGNLEYAGEGNIEQRRVNGRNTILSRSYNLYSDIQRADDIIVILPVEAGEKHFEVEKRVKLINPRITAEGYKIGNRGFTNYILHADDMIEA